MSVHEKEYGYTPSDFEKLFQTIEFISDNVSDNFSYIEKTILTFLINGDHYLATEYLHKIICVECHCPRKISKNTMNAKYIFEKPTRFWSRIDQNPYFYNYGNVDYYINQFFSSLFTEHIVHIKQIVAYIENKDADIKNDDIKNVISKEYKNICDSIKVVAGNEHTFSQILSRCNNEYLCGKFVDEDNNILDNPYYKTILKDILTEKELENIVDYDIDCGLTILLETKFSDEIEEKIKTFFEKIKTTVTLICDDYTTKSKSFTYNPGFYHNSFETDDDIHERYYNDENESLECPCRVVTMALMYNAFIFIDKWAEVNEEHFVDLYERLFLIIDMKDLFINDRREAIEYLIEVDFKIEYKNNLINKMAKYHCDFLANMFSKSEDDFEYILNRIKDKYVQDIYFSWMMNVEDKKLLNYLFEKPKPIGVDIKNDNGFFSFKNDICYPSLITVEGPEMTWESYTFEEKCYMKFTLEKFEYFVEEFDFDEEKVISKLLLQPLILGEENTKYFNAEKVLHYCKKYPEIAQKHFKLLRYFYDNLNEESQKLFVYNIYFCNIELIKLLQKETKINEVCYNELLFCYWAKNIKRVVSKDMTKVKLLPQDCYTDYFDDDYILKGHGYSHFYQFSNNEELIEERKEYLEFGKENLHNFTVDISLSFDKFKNRYVVEFQDDYDQILADFIIKNTPYRFKNKNVEDPYEVLIKLCKNNVIKITKENIKFDDDDKCSICFCGNNDDDIELCKTNCNHIVCTTCYQELLDASNENDDENSIYDSDTEDDKPEFVCPVCRTELNFELKC